ncbi:MAG: DUF1987 domain-containing protein [Spirochaetota bacterium]
MLSIEATKSTPRIHYSEERRTLEVFGESYPENSFSFFAPVFAWFHAELPGLAELTLEVNVKYMNSSSTKCMLDMLDLLVEAARKGCRTRVRWLHEAGNDRALELAEEFKEEVDIPFEIVAIGAVKE